MGPEETCLLHLHTTLCPLSPSPPFILGVWGRAFHPRLSKQSAKSEQIITASIYELQDVKGLAKGRTGKQWRSFKKKPKPQTALQEQRWVQKCNCSQPEGLALDSEKITPSPESIFKGWFTKQKESSQRSTGNKVENGKTHS